MFNGTQGLYLLQISVFILQNDQTFENKSNLCIKSRYGFNIELDCI